MAWLKSTLTTMKSSSNEPDGPRLCLVWMLRLQLMRTSGSEEAAFAVVETIEQYAPNSSTGTATRQKCAIYHRVFANHGRHPITIMKFTVGSLI